MAKDSRIDAVDEQLNHLANSMNDWEQSEHALSEAAAMLSGIARSHSEDDEEKQLEALKQGLDDITASISRMNAAAREDMADVIEQTQRDNELLEAINVEPILEGAPQSEYEVKSEPATANQVKISKVKPLDDETSGMDIDKIAGLFASSNQVKKVSKVKPLEDATSGMDVSKLAGLHKTSSHKEGKSGKASKHSKAPKPTKSKSSGSDMFETVITPENEASEDEFRFVSERELAANPVEWKMDESVLQSFSAAKEQPAEPVAPEATTAGIEPVSRPEPAEAAALSSDTNAAPSEGDSLSTISFASESPAQAQAEAFLSAGDTDPSEDALSTIHFDSDDSPAAESLASASLLPEENESLLQTPQADVSVPDVEEPQPAEPAMEVQPEQPAMAAEPETVPEMADHEPSAGIPGADMQISNDMFDLGIDLSDEPDYSDENIDLNVFSGSIEDAEEYNAASENSVDLDAEYADSGLSQEMDLSNLVAAAMNDLAGRNYGAEPEDEEPEEESDVPTVSGIGSGRAEEDASPQAMEENLSAEEEESDVPTVSEIESGLKKEESEKRRSEGEEVRQQGSAGFAYTLNELDQAAAAAEDEESSEKRVIAQYLVHKRGEDERAYYRLLFQ